MNIEIRTHEDDHEDRGCFSVIAGGRLAERLTWDEMLALVASLTIPSPHVGQQWLKTPEAIEAQYATGTYGQMKPITRALVDELKGRRGGADVAFEVLSTQE